MPDEKSINLDGLDVPSLARWARHVFNVSEGDAEDIVQDVVCEMCKPGNDISRRPIAEQLRYVRTAMRNQVCDESRRTSAERRLMNRVAERSRVVDSTAPTDPLERDEQVAAVSEAIWNLPVDDLLAMSCFYQFGRSLDEIAALLGISQDSVRQRLTRVRKALRVSLK